MYSRTPEIETADLSQSHANLSQFQADCLFCIDLTTATKIFETILSRITTLAN